MKAPRWIGSTVCRRRRAGFTLAETLAALVVMAIVIPVAIDGLRIANRAGVVAQRKSVAVQLADSLLNDLVATGNWQSSSPSGNFGDRWTGYQWRLLNENWTEDNMRMLTVEVTYPVQNQEYSVRLTTLLPPTN